MASRHQHKSAAAQARRDAADAAATKMITRLSAETDDPTLSKSERKQAAIALTRLVTAELIERGKSEKQAFLATNEPKTSHPNHAKGYVPPPKKAKPPKKVHLGKKQKANAESVNASANSKWSGLVSPMRGLADEASP